jgi:hypothetical protein
MKTFAHAAVRIMPAKEKEPQKHCETPPAQKERKD